MEQLTLFPEGPHAKKRALLLQLQAIEPEKACGLKWSELLDLQIRYGSSSNSLQVTRNGKIRLRWLWRALAIQVKNLNLRLRIVAHLIQGNVCSLLPTPLASDCHRSPGSESHCRLIKFRGLHLQEELGARPGPEIVEWMMGYPIGYTDLKPSETP